jgi:hypothetical protein
MVAPTDLSRWAGTEISNTQPGRDVIPHNKQLCNVLYSPGHYIVLSRSQCDGILANVVII